MDTPGALGGGRPLFRAQLYVDGCDVCLDPETAHNVRANLVAAGGRTYILGPQDTTRLGPARVFDGHGCLALYAPWGLRPPAEILEELREWMAAGLALAAAIGRLTTVAGGRPGLADGAPADWWLVPHGPLHDPDALRMVRHIVRAGIRVGGQGR